MYPSGRLQSGKAGVSVVRLLEWELFLVRQGGTPTHVFNRRQSEEQGGERKRATPMSPPGGLLTPL